MSLFMEIETDRKLPFDARKIAELVIETSLDYVKCPYETEVSLLLTTDEEIKEINRMQRQIDRATDVLSFPMADYETPGDFSLWMKMPDCSSRYRRADAWGYCDLCR